jgi:hypothetical protein
MTKIGRFITDPKAGSYCYITLDSGEKILVSHEKGPAGQSVAIHELKWWGFASGNTLFGANLESLEGQRILARLVEGAPPGSARATPLGALVEYVKDSRSLPELKALCAALVPGDSRARA